MKKYSETKGKYEEKRHNKSVSFNIEDDADILLIANEMQFSKEVKNWLREQLEDNEKKED